MLTNILSEKVTVTEGDQVHRLSKGEALVKLTLNRAIKGDDEATAGILALAGKTGRLVDEPDGNSPVRGYLVVPEPFKRLLSQGRRPAGVALLHGARADGEPPRPEGPRSRSRADSEVKYIFFSFHRKFGDRTLYSNMELAR